MVPRPIGWISTISESGERNLAPYSYFNLMGSDPPYVAFGSTGIKDSLRNLREVPEFVANIVTMHLLERMNFTSGDFPHEEDEFNCADSEGSRSRIRDDVAQHSDLISLGVPR